MNHTNQLIIHDITCLVHDNMPLWPGNRHMYNHYYVKTIVSGDGVNISRIACSMHLGTHLDAPYHKQEDGAKLHELPIDKFIGDAYVIDLSSVGHSISVRDIRGVDLHNCRICLLKTSNSALWKKCRFDPDFIHLEKDAATFLVDQNVEVVGVDYLSVDSFHSDHPDVHNILFDANILVYEGLDLGDICEGKYFFIGLPLRIKNAEGSPVRAILLENKDIFK